MKKQQGFTLIELMIVVAIIAILAAIAIPAYRDYLIRTQVSEGASLTGGAKVAVDEYYANYGVAPTTNAVAGLAPEADIKGDYVSQVLVGTNGTITATFGGAKANAAIKSGTLIYTPTFNAGSTSWQCSSAILDKYLPTSCR